MRAPGNFQRAPPALQEGARGHGIGPLVYAKRKFSTFSKIAGKGSRTHSRGLLKKVPKAPLRVAHLQNVKKLMEILAISWKNNVSLTRETHLPSKGHFDPPKGVLDLGVHGTERARNAYAGAHVVLQQKQWCVSCICLLVLNKSHFF